MNRFLKSFSISLIILVPAAALWAYLVQTSLSPDRVLLPYPAVLSGLVLFWILLTFAVILYIEPYRRMLGVLTMPACLGVIAAIFFYLVASGLGNFMKIEYSWLTPVAAAASILAALAVLQEKHFLLKVYLSLSAMMLAVLWALGLTGAFTPPF